MTLRYDNYDTYETQYCTVDDELMRRACHVGPINDTEAIRRASHDMAEWRKQISKQIRTMPGAEDLKAGDIVSIAGQQFVLE